MGIFWDLMGFGGTCWDSMGFFFGFLGIISGKLYGTFRSNSPVSYVLIFTFSFFILHIVQGSGRCGDQDGIRPRCPYLCGMG